MYRVHVYQILLIVLIVVVVAIQCDKSLDFILTFLAHDSLEDFLQINGRHLYT